MAADVEIHPLSARSIPWNLPEGWTCGIRLLGLTYTLSAPRRTGRRSQKVALAPCGRVFTNLFLGPSKQCHAFRTSAARAYPEISGLKQP